MFAIERLGGSEIHRDAMLHHAVLLQDSIEDRERTPAIDHVIFRNDLEPIDHRLALQNVLVMRNAQSNPNAVLGMSVKSIGRHAPQAGVYYFFPSVAQPPLPLQEFLPLQPLSPEL